MTELYNLPVTQIKGVGEKRSLLLKKQGVSSVGALLRFFPRRYEDWSKPAALIEARAEETLCIRAKVRGGVSTEMGEGGRIICRLRAYDENGAELSVIFFNNRFIPRLFHDGEEYIFRGKLSFFGRTPRLVSPQWMRASEKAEIVPVYPQSKELDSRSIRRMMHPALGMSKKTSDPLPERLRAERGLLGIGDALRAVHEPRSMAEAGEGRRRFVFEELLVLETGLLLRRSNARVGCPTVIKEDRTGEFFSLLPFEPTGAQRRAVRECMEDMLSAGRPMARLVQGDVGSGKTAVAAALCYTLAKNGFQSAFMAPTEILAEQHYNTLSKMLGGTGIRIDLLTGSLRPSEKKKVRERIRSGETDIAVGTHALISENAAFSSLGLAIVDEQHRFGVAQRTALGSKGNMPHMLVMSATPIPRTLALIIYGDLDISVLDEMPVGRQPVKTYSVTGAYRKRVFAFIKKHLDAGRQAYLVCPLVDDGEEADKAGVLEYYARLSSGEFEHYSVGLLHGKMRPSDKDNVMRKFASGQTSLLISTTVVEVGVDVPNATVMVVENAERFGLSQLHQLRGRVGRGSGESFCILISDSKSEKTAERLKVLCSTSDGFRIADEDLRTRGPGDFFGSRQHGLPRLTIADLSDDMETVSEASEAARAILEADPGLEKPENRELLEMSKRMFSETCGLS